MKIKVKNKLNKILTSIVLLFIAFLVQKIYDIDVLDTSYLQTGGEAEYLYLVTRVVDGDTIVVQMEDESLEKIRLIGIDTPESVHPNADKNTEEGVNISNYTKETLEGKYVKLELDVQERDKYGRILAYVYIDDNMYNKVLLEKGYAKVATYPPNVKYVDDFLKIEKEAKENKVGLWQE